MYRLYEPTELDEATENLRVIRETMERSTKHSSLSGLAGLLIGMWAMLGVFATGRMVGTTQYQLGSHPLRLAAIWITVLVISALTDIVLNKRRAARVGKRIFSPLGARILQAIGPGFLVGGLLTAFLVANHLTASVFALWMLTYGLAICSVGLFSVKPVACLGWAFVVCGCCAMVLGPSYGLPLMAISFGGFHIAYGIFTGLTRNW